MPHLRLTSKRQATFPVETCEALGLRPGDVLELEPRIEHGERLWLLRQRPTRSRAWVGSLGPFITPVKSHSMTAIRRSIAAGRRKDGLA
jgi:bifunctional DNA-binding transcriptional regulator/antitoxin component of YhaV-PrlF toxin-antitoxin module